MVCRFDLSCTSRGADAVDGALAGPAACGGDGGPAYRLVFGRLLRRPPDRRRRPAP